jgi:acetyl-CoA synthase
MSKVIATSAIEGALQWVAQAEAKLLVAIKNLGEEAPVSFPNTAYYLPVIYSFTGEKITTLGGMKHALARAKKLLPGRPSEHNWLPYLGQALDAGVASLFACEIIEALKYLTGPNPVEGQWLGAANDVILRERGVEFVDGSAPGFAVITGAAPNKETAVSIARSLQEKNLYVFIGGASKGVQFADQLAESGVQLGWETRLVPFGRDVSSLIYALGFANRAALSFGGVKPGDFKANLRYCKNRIFAFVLAFGEVTPDKYALAAGAINYGCPVIADTDIPQILPTGVCTYEHVVSNVKHEDMVETALKVRGCKIKITKVPIPVAYGPAFEGERIRRQDTHVEFGGNKTPAFEFVTSAGLDDIKDGEIQVIGPDIDQVEPGGLMPLAIWVEAAGRKMQPDFEPILERQIHHMVNGAEGVWHMGQRDIIWTRVSNAAYAKGFRLKHYGEIIHAKILSNYGAIVDKVKVTLITDPEEVTRRLETARKIYDERNRRLEAMTDESVEIFYSCLLCQSFAPNHVCVITPQRLGLCGAYNWLDGKAAFEIDKNGPNQPVAKGACLDKAKGIFKGVDDYVYLNSHKTIPSYALYSIMDKPMTSCGCFEAILAYVPDLNGVMAVNREYLGETPAGMTFSSLAGNVGGGAQTPGFMGVGKIFLTSPKFLAAEGGHRRLVWMPKALKELLKPDLERLFKNLGCPDLLDQIADESIGSDPKTLRAHLEKVKHPALAMPDMSDYIGGSEPEPMGAETVVQEAPTPAEKAQELTPEKILEMIRLTATEGLKAGGNGENAVRNVIEALGAKFLGSSFKAPAVSQAPVQAITSAPKAPSIIQVQTFKIPKQKCETPVRVVKLGATKAEGGTRRVAHLIGGSTAMPFHSFEGEMPHRPLVAMEVFDKASEKYPKVLRDIFGSLLDDPAAMAKACVEKYGADLISVRLDGTHPEKGDRTAAQAVETVKAVLSAVDVPLIVTGHNHFEKVNEVMKAVASACAGENLLFNWTEQNNYKAIAGAALAYGHTVVAQGPLDVNITKQLCILMGQMGLPAEKIVIDPMASAVGYGVEYAYSVMERIRLTALGGDAPLAQPMIVSVGQECHKIKELKAEESDFPAWGSLEKRASQWEIATAMSLLYAGADLLVLYHPESVRAVKKAINELM